MYFYSWPRSSFVHLLLLRRRSLIYSRRTCTPTPLVRSLQSKLMSGFRDKKRSPFWSPWRTGPERLPKPSSSKFTRASWRRQLPPLRSSRTPAGWDIKYNVTCNLFQIFSFHSDTGRRSTEMKLKHSWRCHLFCFVNIIRHYNLCVFLRRFSLWGRRWRTSKQRWRSWPSVWASWRVPSVKADKFHEQISLIRELM